MGLPPHSLSTSCMVVPGAILSPKIGGPILGLGHYFFIHGGNLISPVAAVRGKT